MIFAIFLAGLMLRICDIYKYDIWTDEAGSNFYSYEFIDNMSKISGRTHLEIFVDNLKNDTHSPLYYSLVYFYSLVFGGGESIRIISLIFSILTLFVFYRLSRFFLDRQTSSIALFLLAFNPLHIWYAQEGRGYAMAVFFALLFVNELLKALSKQTKYLSWILVSLTAFLAVISNYFASLLVLCTGVIFIKNKEKRKYFSCWLTSIALAFVLIVALKGVLVSQVAFVKNHFWLSPPKVMTLLFTGIVFNLGYTFNFFHLMLAVPLYLFLCFYGIHVFMIKNKEGSFFLACLLFLPILTIFVFSKLFMPVYINRQIIIFSPFIYIFIANGLTGIKRDQIRNLTSFMIVALTALSLWNYYDGKIYSSGTKGDLIGNVLERKNYNDLIVKLDQEFKAGDLIAVTELESYNLAIHHMITNQEKYGQNPLGSFCLLTYPDKLYPFELHVFKVKEAVNSLSDNELEDLYCFRLNGNKYGPFSEEWPSYKRLLLLTTAQTSSAMKLREFLRIYFNKTFTAEQGGINFEIYNLLPKSDHFLQCTDQNAFF